MKDSKCPMKYKKCPRCGGRLVLLQDDKYTGLEPSYPDELSDRWLGYRINTTPACDTCNTRLEVCGTGLDAITVWNSWAESESKKTTE